jgi:hypothetical protein
MSAGDPASEVPEGAAVFPLIPAELHAVVFFDGSDAAVVNDAAADEALQYIATYLQRLEGAELRRIREDVETLLHFARQEKWPVEETQFLQSFLYDYGIGAEENS